MVEKDFRLKVVEGPARLLGLEMALSRWSDEMLKGFRLEPIQASGLELQPGEKAYAEMAGATLSPQGAVPLPAGPNGREPPQGRPVGQSGTAAWTSLGQGRLVATSQRLVWQGAGCELDFDWAAVTAVYLLLVNTLVLVYGQAPYRFQLGHEAGLKWLTYVRTLVQQAAERDGRTVPVSR
jgi:hypothetical protein